MNENLINEARPATEAGRRLARYLFDCGVEGYDHILAIEAEARQQADMTQAKALADAIEAWESASGDWSQVKVRIATIRRLTSEGEPPMTRLIEALEQRGRTG